MAMAVSMDGVSADAATLVATATSTRRVSNIESYKTMMIAVLLTLLCGAIGICFYLRFALGVARGESFAQKMNKTLHQVLDELEYRMGWGIYETKEKTLQEKRRRYLDSEMCEVSDDEYWREIHYGPPWTDQHDEGEESESSLSNDTMLRCSGLSPELRQTMIETNTFEGKDCPTGGRMGASAGGQQRHADGADRRSDPRSSWDDLHRFGRGLKSLERCIEFFKCATKKEESTALLP